MNRNIMRGLALLLALGAGGCFANSSSTGDQVGSIEDELDGPRVVTFEAEGTALSSGGPVDTETTHPTGANLGPQPDPWLGHDGEGPQPDPWLGRTKPPPPPDQGGTPSDGSNKK